MPPIMSTSVVVGAYHAQNSKNLVKTIKSKWTEESVLISSKLKELKVLHKIDYTSTVIAPRDFWQSEIAW